MTDWKGLALFLITGTDPPIYFVKEEIRPDGYDDETYESLYESKMCPADIIGVDAVLTDGDADPHGIFEFVQIVDVPDDWPFTGLVDWDRYRRLFAKIPADPRENPTVSDTTPDSPLVPKDLDA